MPAPEPLEWSDPKCSFETPQGCHSWESMLKLLTQHAQTIHGSSSNQGHLAAKLEKLPRHQPKHYGRLSLTESQWTFTKIQWDRYTGQSPVSEYTKLTQLQTACSDDLPQHVFDTLLYHSTAALPHLICSFNKWKSCPSINFISLSTCEICGGWFNSQMKISEHSLPD